MNGNAADCMTTRLTQQEFNFLMRIRQLQQGVFSLVVGKDKDELSFWTVTPLKMEGVVKLDEKG